MYQTLSELASFCKRYDKTFWCVFRFTVLTAVHLQNVQNANAKIHKVVQRHYSGEAVNVYISVRQIYSGQYVPNFITLDQVLQTVYQPKNFGVFFSVHSVCIYVCIYYIQVKLLMGECARRSRKYSGELDFALLTWKQQVWMKRLAVNLFAASYLASHLCQLQQPVTGIKITLKLAMSIFQKNLFPFDLIEVLSAL